MDEPEDHTESPADDAAEDADGDVDPGSLEEAWAERDDVPTDETADQDLEDVDPEPEVSRPEVADDADLGTAAPVDEQVEEGPLLPAIEPTGHPAVDAVLERLDGLRDLSVHEHVAVFEEAHAALRRALDESGPQA